MTASPVPAAIHRVSIVIDRVRADLAHAWTVPEMAAVIGVSSGQLRRLFMQNFGATPRLRLCALRLEAAARLLADPGMRVKEIRERVGIADASHFCRDFRARFGMSPTEYRESLLPCLRTDTTDNDARWRQEKNDSAH
ncbi:MAG TPA: AraC family transcriptional regulator [Vicinamibacterales bacterium]|nr:AraC family transcriptional regulator [Vicinamibacterales bacterium]